MKVHLAALGVLLSVLANNALAGCGPPPIAGANLTNLLSGSVVCGRPGPGYSGAATDRWQEEHRSGGQLWDYKQGPSDKIDPSKQVGTWSVTGNQVTYVYAGGGLSYVRTVHLISGSTYSFCTGINGTEVVVATITPGTGPCSGYP